MYSYSRLPYTARLGFQLTLIVLLGLLVRFCAPVFIPVYFSLLVAILVLPLNNRLEKLKLHKALAAFISVLVAVLTISGIIYFLSSQISSFLNDVPTIRTHIEEHYITLQNWVADRFNIDIYQQTAMMNKVTASMRTIPDYLEQTFLTATEIITFIALVAVYSFLILFYRHLIRNFFLSLFRDKNNVNEVMTGSKEVIKHYMQGLVIEMFIVAIVNSIVLLVIGIKYAVFLGVFAAILNIIPFIGIFTGIIFTVLVTLTTDVHMSQVIWIIVGMWAVHFVDSNFMMPNIVGSRVKINALITIIAALLGGALIGIGGVFLALPTVAILKIIFDRVEELKPWGFLMGNGSDESENKAKKKISLNKV